MNLQPFASDTSTFSFDKVGGEIAVSSLYPTKPRVTARLRLFHNDTVRNPLIISTQHTLSPNQSASLTFGLGRGFLELDDVDERQTTTWLSKLLHLSWNVKLTRTLSEYSKLHLGIGSGCGRSLSWSIQLSRGDVSCRIPITLSTDAANMLSYSMKAMYVSFVTMVVHHAIGDFMKEREEKRYMLSHEAYYDLSSSLQQQKAKADAQRQILLLSKASNASRKTEESKNGLVIEKAIYGIIPEDETNIEEQRVMQQRIDVTIPLQFWVTDSTLKLPSGSKSHMLGFYDVLAADAVAEISSKKEKSFATGSDEENEKTNFVRLFLDWIQVKLNTIAIVPKKGQQSTSDRGFDGDEDRLPLRRMSESRNVRLFVRYKFGGTVNDITISDEEPLFLP